jgi:hypothetical protein
LNSLVDSPDVGDERNFFNVRPLDTPDSKFTDEVTIEEDRQYRLAVHFSMDADPSLNLVSNNTRVSVALPGTIKGSGRANGFVSANNSSPKRVWESAVLTLPSPDESVALQYVADSARIYTQGKINGQAIDLTSLTSEEGALIGCEAFDGRLDGSPRCKGWVTVDFVTKRTGFLIDSWVARVNTLDFAKEVRLKGGAQATVKLTYENNSGVDQRDVSMGLDSLPVCTEVIRGTTQISNSTTDSRWTPTEQDISVVNPIDIGSIAPGGTAYLKFELSVCGVSKLSESYAHDFANGSLWLEPDILIHANTNHGNKRAAPLLITALGPNQR